MKPVDLSNFNINNCVSFMILRADDLRIVCIFNPISKRKPHPIKAHQVF